MGPGGAPGGRSQALGPGRPCHSTRWPTTLPESPTNPARRTRGHHVPCLQRKDRILAAGPRADTSSKHTNISGIDDRSPVLSDRRPGPPGASPPWPWVAGFPVCVGLYAREPWKRNVKVLLRTPAAATARYLRSRSGRTGALFARTRHGAWPGALAEGQCEPRRILCGVDSPLAAILWTRKKAPEDGQQ
jgi:hypothetical protein